MQQKLEREAGSDWRHEYLSNILTLRTQKIKFIKKPAFGKDFFRIVLARIGRSSSSSVNAWRATYAGNDVVIRIRVYFIDETTYVLTGLALHAARPRLPQSRSFIWRRNIARDKSAFGRTSEFV